MARGFGYRQLPHCHNSASRLPVPHPAACQPVSAPPRRPIAVTSPPAVTSPLPLHRQLPHCCNTASCPDCCNTASCLSVPRCIVMSRLHYRNFASRPRCPRRLRHSFRSVHHCPIAISSPVDQLPFNRWPPPPPYRRPHAKRFVIPF